MGNVETLIDSFVFFVNRHPRQPAGPATPPSVRFGDPDPAGNCPWAILSAPDIEWVSPLERQFEIRFPRAYRALITRWIFPSFPLRVGKRKIILLANTPEGSDPLEFRAALTRPDSRAARLLTRGLLQFAVTADPKRNPVCLDLNRRRPDRDCPVVVLDAPKHMEEIAPSFREMIEAAMK